METSAAERAQPIRRRACPVCGGGGGARAGRGARACRRCGAIWRTRFRAAAAAAWDDDYFADAAVMDYYRRRRSAFRRIVALVGGLVDRRLARRWLDVGCGPGA